MLNAMRLPPAFILALLLPLFCGCDKVKTPTVIVVTASFPGATAQQVADLIAAPLEQQLHGAEGLTRIESSSSNDGSYLAHLRFESIADSAEIQQLVTNRVALAKPNLPNNVQVSNNLVQPANGNPTQVTLAIIDRDNQGWAALKRCAEEALKPLAAANVINNPTAFPIEERQISLNINRDKQTLLGLTTEEVHQAIPPNARELKIEDLQKLTVGEKKIPLAQFVTFTEGLAPSAIVRVNLQPAIRITGAASNGNSVPEAAKQAAELIEAELKRLQRRGFTVENLSDK